MAKVPKIWYHEKGGYTGQNPPYYDLNGVPWFDKLQQNLPDIKQKVAALLKTEGVDIQHYYNPALVRNGWWGGLLFLDWRMRNEETIDKGKEVFAYFRDIPGLVNLTVSILKPNTRLHGHCGYTDAVYRIHLPVYIPAGLPECGMTVAGITKTWTDGELLPFCDAHYHEVWNNTNEPRIIMIMDVLKEEFLPQIDKICADALYDIRLQKQVLKSKNLQKIAKWMPDWMKSIARKILKPFF